MYYTRFVESTDDNNKNTRKKILNGLIGRINHLLKELNIEGLKEMAVPGETYYQDFSNYFLPKGFNSEYVSEYTTLPTGESKTIHALKVVPKTQNAGKYKSKPKSLDNCTVAELKERAAKRKINIKGMKKKEIIDKLRGKK